MRTSLLWLACFLVWSLAASAQALPDKGAIIEDGTKCAALIGAGGNLKTNSGAILPGKCEGAGLPPVLSDGGEVVNFSVRSDRLTPKDRTELAFTDRKSRLQYGRQYLVSFDVSIPIEDQVVTNDFFYMAQFWQSPTKPPIAGLRLQRGSSGKATIMARGDGSPPEGKLIAEVNLLPGAWVSVALRIKVTPGEGSCVGAAIDGAVAPEWCGTIGYVADKEALPWYRFKFGIYKGSEPGKQFRVRFRKVSIREPG